MDKTTKMLISLLGGLAVFVITKDLIISLVVCFWLLFAFLSLPHQIFLFFSAFLLIYYLVFKSIDFIYPAIMVVLGVILSVIPKRGGEGKQAIAIFWHDTKTMSVIILSAFLLLSIFFSYQTYLKQQQKQEMQKEKPPEKVIIRLK